MNIYSFLIFAFLMKRTSGFLGRATPVRGRSQPYAWALGSTLRTVPEWPCAWPYAWAVGLILQTVPEWPCAWPRRIRPPNPAWPVYPSLGSSPTRSSFIFAFLMDTYSFLIFAFLMKGRLLWEGPLRCRAGASRMHGCSDPFGGRSPNGHVYGRHGWSLLIRLRVVCPYLGSSPTRSSLIFAFLMNTYRASRPRGPPKTASRQRGPHFVVFLSEGLLTRKESPSSRKGPSKVP